MKTLKALLFLLFYLLMPTTNFAFEGMPTPKLHVEGKYLVDPHGNVVNLHGFAQTYSPFFNEGGIYWNNYDVNGCLQYNKGIIDGVLDAGWKVNFLRLHMDPYWSNTPGCTPDGHELPNCFDETRFKKYLDEVFIPMAEYAISKGLYVVMRPPGVCPEVIGIDDDYDYGQYLMTVWDIVSSHPKIKGNDAIMFELANEPVRIKLADGTIGNNTQAHFDVLKGIFQPIVDRVRENGFHNVVWIPGSSWQAQYKGYASNPVEGENIGYAVHVYPGWFGSADGYEVFKNEWDENVQIVADFAPIMITEMDWADEKYDASWGKAHTGTAGGDGFGANFRKIMDDAGNVSWLVFTNADLLADYTGIPPEEGEEYTFLNDPEACPWATHHWFEEYASENYPRPDFDYRSHSDNGDGTYTNPLIHADFPDPDVIRVGDVYYMVSTTMHIFPGATLLKSYDLVNWEYCSNPLEIIESDSCYNLDGCDRYGKGQWATSLKYKDGTFYILFNTNDEGSYLLTSTDPEGAWDIKKLNGGYYDPGLFFDNDGKTYVVHGINTLKVTELDENFDAVAGSEQVVFTYTYREGLEGSHLYKINGYYYIYATYGGWPAFQVALRSADIYGPYEEKKLIEDDNIHQGALIQTQEGEWWTIMFYDKGAFGRLPNLQPVTWVNNWPMIGVDSNSDGVWEAVNTFRKPNVGKEYPIQILETNDSFRNYQLGMQWGWNHNSDNSKWSLIDRPDYLRLETVGINSDFLTARNTLTQRIFGYHSDTIDSYGTIKMEIDSMKEGDIAGLCVLQDPYAYIGVEIVDGNAKLIMNNNGTRTYGTTINDSIIYLRAIANYGTSKANFYYSVDNSTYIKFGSELDMKFDLSVFTGNKFAIFNYATEQTGGFVDIDWFTTEHEFNEDKYYDASFVGFSEDALTMDSLYVDADTLNLLISTSTTLKITAHFVDGHTENVTYSAKITNSDPEVVRLINGQVISYSNGESTINVSYSDKLGNTKEFDLFVTSETFPLKEGLFNPSIYADGTFTEESRVLITGQYGFGGWEYDNGIDLSDYKYLVVRLIESPSNASFRLFDEPSYWSASFIHDVGSLKELVIDLQGMGKEVDGKKVWVDPSHIYRIGFWSMGGSPIQFEEVFLTDLNSYTPTHTIVLKPEEPSGISIYQEEDTIVNVYNVMGILVRSQIERSKATLGLPSGIYVVGGEKVFVNNY